MYLPTYTITHLILNYIVKIELAVSQINSTPLPQSHFSQIYEKLHAEDILKLGDLIGFPIGYTKALDVQRGRVMPSLRPKFKVFTNFRSVHDYIDSYTNTEFIKPSVDLCVHINKLMMKGIIDEWDSAKIRNFSEKPNEIYDTWYKYRDFYPNIDNRRYFSEIFAWIEDPKIKVNKLIQLSALIYEFIDKAPFNAGNQMTSILVLATLAKAYGYNPFNILPFAKSMQFIDSDISQALKIAKNKRDITVFVEAFLYTFSLMAVSTLNMFRETYDIKVKESHILSEEFNSREIKILEYLEIEKRVTRKEYAKIMGVSFMTAFRDLTHLLTKDMITQKGNGRGTYYTLKRKDTDHTISVVK